MIADFVGTILETSSDLSAYEIPGISEALALRRFVPGSCISAASNSVLSAFDLGTSGFQPTPARELFMSLSLVQSGI